MSKAGLKRLELKPGAKVQFRYPWIFEWNRRKVQRYGTVVAVGINGNITCIRPRYWDKTEPGFQMDPSWFRLVAKFPEAKSSSSKPTHPTVTARTKRRRRA